MKKLLLSLAVVLGLMPSINANAADATITQKWIYSSENLGSAWNGDAPNWSSSDAIKTQSCSRFATAQDGKIYTLNMKTMSIAQVTGDGIKDLYKLPSLEGRSININGTDVPDYYGTSISIDQAGNFIIGHYFTKAESVLHYTVYSPKTNKAKHFSLDVPTGMMVMRNDCMGRVLGDLTKDAYAYIPCGDFVQAGGVVTPGTNGGGTYATNQKVRVLHFTGDGDVDNITMTDEFSPMIYLGSHNTYNNICQPIYASMEEAKGVPATSTFISASNSYIKAEKKFTATYFGFTADGKENWGYSNLGSSIKAGTAGFDTFVSGGKRYYVRNNINSEVNYDATSTMDIAVYDEAFNIVATWSNAAYTSDQGYSTIIAEPVEGGANIYVYNSTGLVNGEKKNWGVAAMLFFGVPTTAPEGSAENPYRLSTPEDLCAMHSKIVANQKVYFVLENDIDMTGVTDYVPVIGSDGVTYFGEFDFDGQNHVIKNFAPEAKYSYMSLFGVIRGDVRNLGVENATVVSNSLGAGILGGYGSQGGVNCVIENVWATGSVTGSPSIYAGGLVGTNGNNLTIKNSYFRGDVFGNYAGGLVGRARAGVSISNSYAAGEVSAVTKAGGIAGTDKDNSVSIVLDNVIAWNTSVDAGSVAEAVTPLSYTATTVKVWNEMTINGQTVADGVSADDLAAAATAWEGYKENLIDGYPALSWQLEPLGSKNNPFVISTAAELAAYPAIIPEGVSYAVLTADIDMKDVSYKPATLDKIGAIVHFDGRNHIISNLSSSSGLFCNFNGSVKNLGVANATISGGQWAPAGIIMDYAKGEVVVDNCFTTGTVNSYYAAGMVGGVENGSHLTITNCYSIADIVSSNGHAGGLVGPINPEGSIDAQYCYASGTVKGFNTAGGVFAGAKTYLVTTPTTANLSNIVSWNSTVNCSTSAGAIIPEFEYLTTNLTDGLVWSETLVNGAAVEGGVAAWELQKTITGWPAFNNKLANGMPVLAWQEATEDLVDPTIPGGMLNPYKVATVDDLFDLADKFGNGTDYVVLEADLDLEGEVFLPLESKGTVIFDGQNHVIKNLKISSESASLFLNFRGSIKNLGMENVDFTSGTWGTAGAIIAYAVDEALIENCYATGKTSGFYAGGIAAGVQQHAVLTVRNCYVNMDITSPNGWAGGVVGPTNQYGKLIVENCYAAGTVNGKNGGGGIAAGANTNYTNNADVVLSNVVAWNTTISGASADAIIPASTYLVAETTNAKVWSETLVNGATVDNGETTTTLQKTVTGWAAFNDKLSNGMPVLAWQEANEEIVEVGSQENPYRISTPAQLCDMYKYMVAGKRTYIVLEDDIDMEGVTDYHPAIGYNGMEYIGEIDFDGQNHVIKNFAPDAKYYYMSLFGVVRGNVRNLGVENCEIVSELFGAGVLGGYGSHEGIDCVIDNVWATGSVTATTSYAGGLIGTNGANLTIKNSYFRGDVEGTIAGGLVGRARAGVTIENAYAAGNVTGLSNAGGIAGTDKDASVSIVLNNVIAWNNTVESDIAAAAVTTLGYDNATVLVWDGMKVNEEAVTGGVAETVLQTTATGWDAYNDQLNDGMPVLAWQEANGSSAVEGIEANDNAAPVYYNLQGVRVQNPANGVFIVKRGNKVSKVFIR